MLNEGLIVNNSAALVKSAIVTEIRRLDKTTPDELERAVFKAVTGYEREDVDWDVEDNQAGYYLWLKSFDGLVNELVEDDYILVEEGGETGERRLVAHERLPDIEYSHLVYPPGSTT